MRHPLHHDVAHLRGQLPIEAEELQSGKGRDEWRGERVAGVQAKGTPRLGLSWMRGAAGQGLATGASVNLPGMGDVGGKQVQHKSTSCSLQMLPLHGPLHGWGKGWRLAENGSAHRRPAGLAFQAR